MRAFHHPFRTSPAPGIPAPPGRDGECAVAASGAGALA